MQETIKRAASGAVYILLLLFSILYSKDSFFILFGMFLVLAVYEYCDLVLLQKIIPFSISVLVYLFFYKYTITPQQELILLAITLFVSINCIYFLFSSSINVLKNWQKLYYLLGYIILPFVLLTKIPFGINGYNPKIIIGIFILIWTNDTFAYIVGKTFGKHKLLERISPKKTIEGFLGGLFFSILAAILISKYYIAPSKEFLATSLKIWIIISIIVTTFGTLGDLVESKLKRMANVKDSGKIMPGHGGILDRLDSIIFAAPFVYLFFKILNYVS